MAGHRQFVGLRISDQPGAVPTVSDIDEGELAINTASARIYVRFGSAIRDITDGYSQGDIDQMLGTAAGFDAPESGNATDDQVVLGTDTRLSNKRPPTAHRHPWEQVDDKPATATRWPMFSEVQDPPAEYPPTPHTHPLSQITGAGTAAAADAGDFDPAGSAAHAESRINTALGQRPDPLLMHFL